ncbi:hypothetical protein M0805_004387 [Coniferiporia weirii]|nr:hypothetical protein M0805_004387 [Coniferiporia weirii]
MKTSSLVSRSRGHGLRCSADSFSWIFRTNLPPRRGMPLPPVQKRNFFGFGEVLSVLTNPGETLRSLTEARKSLEEARQEIKDGRERAQLRTTHTFAPLPGFFSRPAELRTLKRILEGTPAFTILCGASSVGKTALLREVLSADRYHVLHFDLRIAGFADLCSLYLNLSGQMERYFSIISREMEGYDEFEKDAWAFKHDRLKVEHLIDRNGPDAVKTSDIARLMELFQSSLLHYWEFEPKTCDDNTSSEETKVGHAENNERAGEAERSAEKSPQHKDKPERPAKRIPVIFFDEAHKLPVLIRSTEAMKCLLDAMLVLTKQDRLCHVVHATSDSFYQTWLRQLNIMQHCKVICIGDCTKTETQAYFTDRLLPGVPEELRKRLNFEALYEAFGGKLVHWSDYISDFVNANGELPVEKSSHFLQAYALLNMQLIHASELEAAALEKQQEGNPQSPAARASQGFKIYTPLSAATMVAAGNGSHTGGIEAPDASSAPPTFTALQLLDVMHRLSRSHSHCVRYFALCRMLGVRAVDDMVRARVLQLRWSETVSPEGGLEGSIVPLDEEEEAPGPKLFPTTPIITCAMRTVLREYDYEPELDPDMDELDNPRRDSRHGYRSSAVQSDDRSDYMSLSEVYEY